MRPYLSIFASVSSSTRTLKLCRLRLAAGILGRPRMAPLTGLVMVKAYETASFVSNK
jgi:hypothetical protein